MKRVVGFGAGGHGRQLLEILSSDGGCEIVGFVDADPAKHGRVYSGVRVLGGEEVLPGLLASGVQHFVLGVGAVGDNRPRAVLFERIRSLGFRALDVVHPSAQIASSVRSGEGLVVLPGAVINSGARLGVNVICNTGAIIEHDCVVGDHAHISPGAVIGGEGRIGTGAHIGIGATLRQGLLIGEHAIVAAGAVVVRDVLPHERVAGVPARRMR